MLLKPTVRVGGLVGLAVIVSLPWSAPIRSPGTIDHAVATNYGVASGAREGSDDAETARRVEIDVGVARCLHALATTDDARERWRLHEALAEAVTLWPDETLARFWLTDAGRALIAQADVDTMGLVMTTWAGRDADAALGFAMYGADELRGPLTLAVVRGMTAEALRDAAMPWTAWTTALREEVAEAVVAQGISTPGLGAGADWIDAVVPAEQRALAYSTWGVLLANVDPVAASQWVDAHAGLVANDAKAAVASAWAKQDPVTALRWALAIDSIEDPGRIAMQVMRVYAEQDLTTAGALIEAMMGDAYWDHTREVFALAQRDAAPELARKWAGLVVEPARRTQLLARLAR